MRIILAPAKQMREAPERAWNRLPALLPQTELLLDAMRGMDPLALRELWKCSDSLVMENLARLETIDLKNGLTPALFAYEGIAYRYLSPGTLSAPALAYLERNLRILSGFYGILRPDDGVTPYRLEMQAKLRTAGAEDLYDFWGDAPARELRDGSGIIINLASKEYSVCIERHLLPGESFITCVFGQRSGTKLVQKGVYAKMARGAMARFMAENAVETPSGLREFEALGFSFDAGRSDDRTYVFSADTVRGE